MMAGPSTACPGRSVARRNSPTRSHARCAPAAQNIRTASAGSGLPGTERPGLPPAPFASSAAACSPEASVASTLIASTTIARSRIRNANRR
jgi:hypothetical protein